MSTQKWSFNKRCVMAAVSDGAKVVDNDTALWLLRSRCGMDTRGIKIIREGPVRPVWGGGNNYFIPYWHKGEIKAKIGGLWVERVLKEEQEANGKE